jgi:hypothetical protein
MTPATEPQRRFQRGVILQVAACWSLALLAGLWAWRVTSPTLTPTPTPRPAAMAAAQAAPSDSANWNVILWRPFGDTPAPAAAPPASLKLFSILQQPDGLTAAIATSDGLVYVRSGDTCKGFAVVRVEASAVILRGNGQELRLGLQP